MAIRAAEELARARPTQDTVCTIGTFDGVHLGHQHLIRSVIERAQATGGLSGVITFHTHPRNILRPDQSVPCLSDLAERVELLRGLGADMVVPLTFDLALSGLSAREFLRLLVDNLRLRHLVVGPDFALGHQREGTVPVLRALGEEMGVNLEVVEPFRLNEERVSSTAIRRALAAGDVAMAQDLLGRPYILRGTVVVGHRRGKGLGFPTANVALPRERALPADGVYATRAHLDGTTYPSVTNVGDNPTFGDAERGVEVYIFDFDREIYGAKLGVEMVHRLRGEERFPSVEALVAQIRRDVEDARAYLRRG